MFSLFFFLPFVRADQSGAAAAISSAKSQIMDCYNAAKEAEAAGANITELTGTLNEAGLLLSNAEFAFSNGDFSSAQDLAVQSQSKLVDFASDANALLIVGVTQQEWDFRINVVGSIIGTVAVLVVSVGLWSIIDKKYRVR